MVKEFDNYQIRKPGQKTKGTITQLKTMKASEIFKEKAKNPEQLIVVVTADVDGWIGKIASFNKPPSKSILPTSKLAKYMQRYGRLPEVGQVVDVECSARGYWALVL